MGTGLLIREAREHRQLGVRELARLAEISPSHLTAIEQGRRTPSLGMLTQIAKALNIDPGTLLVSSNDEGEEG